MAGRGRKKSNPRMDAAIAVLGGGGFGPGFPGPVIRRTIKKLLNVYGGQDGWPFIQENCYQLLIDTMLDDQEETEVYGGQDGWPFIQENSYQLVIDTMLADQEETEDRSKNGDDAGAKEADEQVIADGELVPQDPVAADGEPSSDIVVGADVPAADVNWKDISCNDPDPGQPSNEIPDCPMEIDDHPRQSVVPPRASPVSDGENVVPPRPKRQPCYGYIIETI